MIKNHKNMYKIVIFTGFWLNNCGTNIFKPLQQFQFFENAFQCAEKVKFWKSSKLHAAGSDEKSAIKANQVETAVGSIFKVAAIKLEILKREVNVYVCIAKVVLFHRITWAFLTTRLKSQVEKVICKNDQSIIPCRRVEVAARRRIICLEISLKNRNNMFWLQCVVLIVLSIHSSIESRAVRGNSQFNGVQNFGSAVISKPKKCSELPAPELNDILGAAFNSRWNQADSGLEFVLICKISDTWVSIRR